MVVTSICDMSMPETNTTTNKQGKEKTGNTKKGKRKKQTEMWENSFDQSFKFQ